MSSDDKVPVEGELHIQMMRTLKSLERWADASVEFMQAESALPEKSGVVEKAPERKMARGYGDTRAVCSRCEGVVVFENYVRVAHSEDDTCVCSDGYSTAQMEPDTRARFESVRQHWVSTQPEPVTPLQGDIEKLRWELDRHRKALAIIATFGQFKDIFFGTKPDEKVASLAKLKACSCVGTGWVARDEQCRECNSRGYIEKV